MTLPGGKTEVAGGKAGQVVMMPGGDHLPQSVGDKPMELILVELKSKSGGK